MKQDTIDFFYWTIPSKDFTIEKLKNMSAEIDANDGTNNQLAFDKFNSFDMNIVYTGKSFDRASGIEGSSYKFMSKRNRDGDVWDFINEQSQQYENIVFKYCPNENLYMLGVRRGN